MDSQVSLIGQSFEFLDAIERASRAAALNRPVLVIGERGTGKELIAERLHHLSTRWAGPLVTMNCAALPENLIDSELFGYEAGAFTGAVKARAGRFEEADGGSLFLDEIATLSAGAQERLLRVIEYGDMTRVGSNRAIRVDVRVIGATNVDLPALAEAGKFRSDLLDRLSFEVVTLPPLRARVGDVRVLAEHFGRRMAVELGWNGFPDFTPEAWQALEAYHWPGNIRELKNVVERSLYRWDQPDLPCHTLILDPFESPYRPQPATEPAIEVKSLPPALTEARGTASVDDFRGAVAAYEKDILEQALGRCRHNQRATARALKLSYDQLRHALRRHGML